MGDTVNVYDAKSRFSRLLARVEAGDEIVISRHGRPIARLVPYQPDRIVRRPGAWKGRVTIAADFDDFTAADERAWYGE
ncbi:type II toxin-antitoxin system Phd/YefM family antitoxin [Mycobacterium sp. NPDC003449]